MPMIIGPFAPPLNCSTTMLEASVSVTTTRATKYKLSVGTAGLSLEDQRDDHERRERDHAGRPEAFRGIFGNWRARG